MRLPCPAEGARWDGGGLSQRLGPWPAEGWVLFSEASIPLPFLQSGLGSGRYHLRGPKLTPNANQEGNYNNVKPRLAFYFWHLSNFRKS